MLGTLATISPLLGLLGTVVGMITAFTGLSEVTGAIQIFWLKVFLKH